MLEDSISCSPGNDKKKSRSRRFHKKSKRKSQLYNVTPTDENIFTNELPNLEALYEESIHSTTLDEATKFELFNPFENEKLLAAADRAETSNFSTIKLKNLTSNGFVSLESVRPFKEKNKIFPMKPPEQPLLSPTMASSRYPPSTSVLCPETQFGITESEFFRFCDKAETDVFIKPTSDVRAQKEEKSREYMILDDFCSSQVEDNDIVIKTPIKSKSIVDEILADFCGSPTDSEIEAQTSPDFNTKTLKGTKSIVDEILEDFCGSPYIGSPQKQNSDESTPIFRFKSQPIRTYSKLRQKRQTRRNINNELNIIIPENDGNASDSSSGLSVQEDLSQSVAPQLDTVDLNNSVKLCENLLNLSSYFSKVESSPDEKSPPIVLEKTETLRFSAIVAEIIKIKTKSSAIKKENSEDEFRGFSDNESDSKDSTLKELLEDEDDVLQQINCDSLCYEKIDPTNSFTQNNSDVENTLKNASAVIEKANRLMLLRHNQNVDDSPIKNKKDCDTNKNNRNKSLPNSPLNDEQLFDDVDIWNDNECLLDYKTQQKNQPNPTDHVENVNLNANDNTIDKINHKPAICIRNDSESQIPSIEKFKFNTKEALKNQQWLQNTEDPCTSSRMPIVKPNTIKRNSNEYTNTDIKQITMNDDTSIKCLKRKNNPKEFLQEQIFNKLPVSNTIGFKTASKKPISISASAMQKANEFVKNFEQEEIEEKINESKDVILKQDFAGFSTASKKPLPISKENKLKADEIFNIFEKEGAIKEKDQEPCVISYGVENPINTKATSCLVGFSTASKKPILISDEAKEKADGFLKKFEQEERKKILHEAIDNNKQQNNLPEINSRNNLAEHCFVGFSTASKKPVPISVEAKRKADEMLKAFEQAERDEQTSKDMAVEKFTQRNPDEISEEVRRKAQELLLDIEFFEEAFEDELNKIEALPISQLREVNQAFGSGQFSSAQIFTKPTKEPYIDMFDTDSRSKVSIAEIKEPFVGGFKTASRKPINISEAARQHAEQFLKTVDNEDLPHDFLNCIETELNDAFKNVTNPVDKLMRGLEQVDGTITSPGSHLHHVIKTKSEHLHVTKHFDIKRKFSNHDLKKKLADQGTVSPSLDEVSKKTENSHRDTTNSRDSNRTENTNNRKRKRSEGHGEELPKSPLLVTPRRLSCVERTPLNRIENGLIYKTSSLPLGSTPNSALMSRKNLLSLSKRKKTESPGQIMENGRAPKTPEKKQHVEIPHTNASSTPNLKEFFDSVSTSTPRMPRNAETKTHNPKALDSSIDPDFRQIQWDDSNNSIRINRTSCVTDTNVTFSQVSPSPKQRIELLKIYGEPPPISPILMVNKCRTSGLRRGRSLMKR